MLLNETNVMQICRSVFKIFVYGVQTVRNPRAMSGIYMYILFLSLI